MTQAVPHRYKRSQGTIPADSSVVQIYSVVRSGLFSLGCLADSCAVALEDRAELLVNKESKYAVRCSLKQVERCHAESTECEYVADSRIDSCSCCNEVVDIHAVSYCIGGEQEERISKRSHQSDGKCTCDTADKS